MILDEIPKNGKIQKGQFLSLRFFENRISRSLCFFQLDLEFVKMRIREILRYENQRKGRRPALLTEEEYLQQYFKAHSMNNQYSIDLHEDGHEKINKQNSQDKTFHFLNNQFLQNYPLFYQPKWKIFLNHHPSLRTLAMLNHLAYGYFYEENQEGELVEVLEELEEVEEEMSLFRVRSEVLVVIGTGKFLSRNQKESHQFQYVDYIELYLQSKQNPLNKQKDPRKNFNKKQLKKKHKNQKMIELTLDKIKYKLSPTSQICVCPSYQNLKVDSSIVEEYLFQLRRYFWGETLAADEDQRESIQNRNNRDKEDLEREQFMLRNIVSFENSSKLVPLLQKIPNFAYHLSNQEKQVIETKGNMIIIGRSGTGKTTCALLRLFSLETLFKVKSVTQRKFSSKDLDAHSEMRNIFLTASPFLIQELKKSYVDHQVNLKFELQKKQLGVVIKSNPVAGEKRRIDNSDEIRLAEENIALLNKKSLSLSFLKPVDFPGFFTVKNFLIMLDGIYNQNFFLRGKGKQFYNQHHKKNFREQMKLDLIERQRFWIKNQKGIYEESTEVDYEYFYDNFWKTQIEKRKDLKCNLTPMAVWAEIFSTIQGSTQAHKCPKFYIGEERYIQVSKNRFLTGQEKRQVFFIFKLYKNWKLKLNKFDQTDLVNHLLRKILRNSYLGPTINFLFIDEVQDLTPATIYLASIITTNNVFYAGDTAQSISKGVLFKFSDIKLMFKNEVSAETIQKQEPEIKQLTVNFRSHNSILRIANCLIKIIQIIFPKTIDSLRKQTSTTKGPKPILIEGDSEVIKLLNLQKGKKDYNFTSRQAIIVRNQEKKFEAKRLFPGGLVLTITECKGLQYEDVVLWDLLQGQKNDSLWKILEVISINEPEKKEQQILQEGAVYDEIQDTLTSTPKLKQYNINDYHELCSEIKLLYTAITRSKQILIIYHSIPQKLLKLLRSLDLVVPCSKKMIEEVQNYKLEKKEKLDGKVEEKQVQFMEWKKAGLEFFKKQNYEQALVCFHNIGDKNACKQIRAKIELKKAEKLAEALRIKKMFSNQQNFKDIEKQISEAYHQAAITYLQIQRHQVAGKLFFKAQRYEQAIKCFRKQHMFRELAQCYLEIKQYTKAAENYQKVYCYREMIDCLVQDRRFLLALIKMVQYSSQFQDFGVKKEKFKAEILREIQEMYEYAYEPLESSKILQQTNKVAFFISSQQIMKEKSVPLQNRMIFKKFEKIKNFPIQQLRIALEFGEQNIKLSIQSYLNKPFSIRELVNSLEKMGHILLCLIVGGMNQFHEKFQYYFPVFLAESYYRSIDNQREFSAENQISRINFDQLCAVQKNQNSQIVNNLVKNLMCLGFCQSCDVFFEKKSEFDCKFMLKNKFLKEMKEKYGGSKQSYKKYEISEICQLAYMKKVDWDLDLEESQAIYSFQILFYQYHFNQQIVKDIKNRLKQLKTEYFSMMPKLQLERKYKTEFLQKIKASKLQIEAEEQILKKKKQQDQKAITEFKKLHKQKPVKQIQKMIQQQIKSGFDKNQTKMQKPEPVSQKLLESIVNSRKQCQNLSKSIQRKKQQISQKEEKSVTQKQELRKIENQMDEWRKIENRINKISPGLEYGGNFFQIHQLFNNNLNQNRLLFDRIQDFFRLKSAGPINIYNASPFLQDFYKNLEYYENQLQEILEFNIQENSYLVMCEVLTLGLSLLFKHENSMNVVQNYRKLKIEEKKKGFLNKAQKKTVRQRKAKVNQFFAKILYIIEKKPLSTKFNRVILKFFNCVIFDENDEFDFLRGFGLIKAKNFYRVWFKNREIQKNLMAFDKNKELFIGRSEYIIRFIKEFIQKGYFEIFQQPLNEAKIFKQKQTGIKLEKNIEEQIKIEGHSGSERKYKQKKQQNVPSEKQKQQKNQDRSQGESKRKARLLRQARIQRRQQISKSDKQLSNQQEQRNEQEDRRNQQDQSQQLEQQEIEQKRQGIQQKTYDQKSQRKKEQIQKQKQKELQQQIIQKKEKASNQRIKLEEQYRASKQTKIAKIEQIQGNSELFQRQRVQIIQRFFSTDFESMQSLQGSIFNMLQKLQSTEKSINKYKRQIQKIENEIKLLQNKFEIDIKAQQIKAKKLEEAKKRLEEETLEYCPICLQKQHINLLLRCNHRFHLKCIMDFLKQGFSQNCPICRDEIFKQYQENIVAGICEQCNTKKVSFNLKQYFQEKNYHPYCEGCTVLIQENSNIGNNIYSYFSKRSDIIMKKLHL